MIVYITTNLINGRKYIGSHAGTNPNYLGSGVYLKEDIKKYGKKSFIREILAEVDNVELMKELEEYYIDYYSAFNSDLFYNATKLPAGITKFPDDKKINVSTANKGNKYNQGRIWSKESRKKSSETHTGFKLNKEQIEKIRKSKLGNKFALGLKHSEESNRLISKNKIGHKCYENPERGRKISITRKLNKIKNTWTTNEKSKRSINQLDLNGNFIKKWFSLAEASKLLKIDRGNISACCRGKLKTTGGFKWSYCL